jgi:site-specific recombinase XerD
MTTTLTKSERSQELVVRDIVAELVAKMPRLVDLDAATLKRVAGRVIEDEVKAQMKSAVDLDRVDYAGDRKKFLAMAKSPRTRDLYDRALSRLEAWCKVQGFSPVELDPARADDWIMSERSATCRDGTARAASSVRLYVSGCSAFWTFLERRYNHLRGKNPFRGTRARPPAKPKKTLAVPSDAEITRLIEAARKPTLRAAIVCMASMGLRVGALETFTVNGARWTAHSKGKDHRGAVPDEARKAIEAAGLSLRAPFAGTTSILIAKSFAYLTGKLHAAGAIRARYSVHDLRHAFAVRKQRETKDVYAVKQALGHSSVSVTEGYLRSLEAVNE